MNSCSNWPCHTLTTLDQKPYLSMAFDGCFYYLTMSGDKNIYKFDGTFYPKGEFKSSRSFSGLCYDSSEECFWATEATQHNKIFKLNRKLQEIDCINFENHRCDYRRILGISYDCAKNVLVAAFNDEVFEISKTGEAKPLMRNLCPHVLSVVSIAPYTVIAVNEEKRSSILYYKGGKLVKTENVPLMYRISDIVYNPCEHTLMLLVNKHCKYTQVLCCPLGLDTDCCHKVICHKKCKPSPPPPEDKCSIINSVALMEAALSHILNAEGEKLQKAVELAGSVGELLEINQSIHKTLMLASQLENILYAKLQTATELE